MSRNIFLYQGGKLEKFGVENLPTFKESNNIDWVVFGTEDDWVNQQPQYYDYLAKTSPKNNAILTAKNRYVYGKGLQIDNASPTSKVLSINERAQLDAFLVKIRKTKVARKIISDGNKHNGFAVEIIYDKANKRIMPHHIPFMNVRVSKDTYNKSNKLEPTVYYYTKDWSKGGMTPSKNKDFVTFEPFDWDVKSLKENTRYLIYYKGDDYADDTYPLPNYVGGIPYIAADVDVANYVKNNTANSFAGGYMVNFYNGEPTLEQKKEISDQFDTALTGSDNAGKVVKSFNENKESGVEITPLGANGTDDRYINLNNQIRDEIFTSHTTSPLVVGMKGENGFNNNADEKRVAVEDFTESFVLPTQEPYNELFNNILDFNDIKGDVHLERLDPIKPQLSVDKLFEIATKTELRDLYRSAGYELSEDVIEEPIQQQLKEINLVFSAEDDEKDANAFKEFGILDETFTVLDTKPIYAKDVFDAQKQSNEFQYEFANKIESALLKLILDTPDLTTNELSDLLKETPETINSIIDSLEADGLLDNGQVTEQGKTQATEGEVFAVYKYVLRSDAPLLVEGGKSRPFCENLVKQSKYTSWTIEDIQLISAQQGYDVFTRRGGWYHNPDTDKNTPYCRHQWQVKLVRLK